jgi:hypothetical protein
MLKKVPSYEDAGGGVIAPRILNLGTRWRWVVRPLYLQERNSRYSLDMWLGGPQSRSGRGSGKKKYPFIVSAGIGTPVVQSLASHITDYCIAAHNAINDLPYISLDLI